MILKGNFPEPSLDDLADILNGNIQGRNITHVWYVENNNIKYEGKILEFVNPIYTMYYYRLDNDHDEEYYPMDKYDIAADFLTKDFRFN